MKKNFLENYKLEGEILNIHTYPAPILKKVATPVTEFNEELHVIVKNMLFTMYNAPGIGLAAPQVGVSIRMFVLDIWFDREKITFADGSIEYRLSEFSPMVFCNPVFKIKSGVSCGDISISARNSLGVNLRWRSPLDLIAFKNSL